MKLSGRDPYRKRKCFWFAGYDFMGGACWDERFSFDYGMADDEDVEQIVKDLQAAD